ncbi:ubiquitinyl hydrolase 1 [Ranunculus cassubicifolius]
MIELGFQNSILIFVFLCGLITSFVIRWKWNKSVERKKEVLRLLAMAKEEAARVEIEAAVEYGSVYVVRQSQCAVCFSPTTTRCSRCKAVKYCSGKCQIVHWRQGHKDECYPAKNTFQYNGPDTDSDQRDASQGIQNEGNVNSVEVEESCKDKVGETYIKGVESSISNNSDHKVGGELGEAPVVSDSVSTSSAETPAVTAEEPLVDTVLPNLPFSDAPVGLQKSVSRDMSQDVPVIRSNDNDVKLTKSSSPEHEPLVDASPVDSVSNSNDGLKQPLLDDTAEDVERKTDFNSSSLTKSPSSLFSTSDDSIDSTSQSDTTSSSGSSFYGPYGSKVSYQSIPKSDFWEEALGSNEFEIDVYDDSTQSSLSQAGEDNLADSKLRTSETSHQGVRHLHEKLNPSIHLPEATASGIVWKKSARRIISSEPLVADTSKSKSSPTMRSEKPTSVKSTSRSTHLFGLGARSSSVNTSRDDKLSGGRGQSVSDIDSSATATIKKMPTGSSGTVNSMTNVGNGLKTSVKKAVQPLNVYKHSKHYAYGLGMETVEKYKYKMLFPYEQFVELYHWKDVELHPCGLKNCGNSCYANAVLQCLTFTRPLAAYLLQRIHSKACPKKVWCFMCEFEGLILKMDGKSLLSPVSILSQLKNNGSHLGDGRQEDAHEFLRYVIDTMQSVCSVDTGGIGVGPPAEETSLIGLIFGGYLQSRIRCMKCHVKSEKHERMMDLTVEIQGGIGTLEDALKQFTATEILDKENMYNCLRCRSYEKARKKLTIFEAPNVLTIALKRFQSGQNGKINKPVKFPLVLDLCPYMSRTTTDRSPVYSLYAVVVHLDTNNATSSGHYVCYVKTIQGKWFNIDDSTVKPVDSETVLSQKAYMLLYARISPRAPSSARTAKTVENPISTTTATGPRGVTERPEDYPYWTTLDPYNRRFGPMQVDSSSDNSSLFSCSDEGSCSTESTRDSTSDDFPEYIHTTDSYRVFESPPILDSNTSKNCRDLTNSENSSSSNNETDKERLGHSRLIDVNSGVPQRRISRETNAVGKFY